MEGLVFSGNAVVHFDGVSAYDEHMVISGGKLVMNLEGEDGLRIVIRDHRQVGFGTMMSVMSDPQTAHFSHHFQSPARVRVYKEQAGDVRIDLFDTYDPPLRIKNSTIPNDLKSSSSAHANSISLQST